MDMDALLSGSATLIPVEWDRVARRFGGLLVGGCLRDTLFGRPVKDVDIFVPGLTAAECKEESEYHDGNRLVREFSEGGWDYQIVKHRYSDDPFEVLDSFDIGLCRIAYRNGLLLLHPDFIGDMQNKRLTVRRKTRSYEKHLARLAEKYPDYEVVDLSDDDSFYSALEK